MTERDTANRILGYADALVDCVKDKHITIGDALVLMGAYGVMLGEKEKRVEGIGPHTNTHNSGGLSHPGTHSHTRTNAHAATLTGTHTTQVPANTGVDTTSRK